MGVVGCGLAIYITPRLRQFASLAFMPPNTACTRSSEEHQGHGGESLRVFGQFAQLEAGSVKMASSHPTRQRVMQTVGRTVMRKDYTRKGKAVRATIRVSKTNTKDKSSDSAGLVF